MVVPCCLLPRTLSTLGRTVLVFIREGQCWLGEGKTRAANSFSIVEHSIVSDGPPDDLPFVKRFTGIEGVFDSYGNTRFSSIGS